LANPSKACSGVENDLCGVGRASVEADLASALCAGAGIDSANPTATATAVDAITRERVLVLFMIFSG
jgi:hypothetical protein